MESIQIPANNEVNVEGKDVGYISNAHSIIEGSESFA